MNRRSTLLLVLGLFGGSAVGCATAPPPRPLTAIEQLKVRVAQDPADLDGLIHLAEYYLATDDHLRARQYHGLAERLLQRAAPADSSINDDKRDTVIRLGLRIAVRSSQYRDAIARCAQLLEQTEQQSVRLLLALLYEAVGEEPAAARQRRLLLSLYPEDLRLLLDTARFYERSRLPDRLLRAQEYYHRYLSATPGGPDAAVVRAALVANELDQHPEKE